MKAWGGRCDIYFFVFFFFVIYLDDGDISWKEAVDSKRCVHVPAVLYHDFEGMCIEIP